MDKTRVLRRALGRALDIEGLESPANAALADFGLALACAAVGLRVLFWAYTGRVWEDSLITVLHSENLVNGLGLTHYRTGEPPLHGFTSPLSVLIPLMGDVFKVGFGLEFIRIVSLFAGGLAVIYALAIAIHPKVRLPAPLAAMVMLYVAGEHHQILWGAAGMETQMAVLVLLMTFYYTVALKPGPLGIGLGLCMLARPDFAFWAAIAGAYLLVRARGKFLETVAIALAVYLPWIVFTTAYYGSPMPNTIVAKHLGYWLWTTDPGLTWAGAWENILGRVTGTYRQNTVFQPLGPSFSGHGAHFRPLIADRGLVSGAMTLLALAGGIVALAKRQWAYAPLFGFLLVYAAYYVFFVNVVFGWYLVPFVLAPLLLGARGIEAVAGGLVPRRARTAVLTLIAVAYAGSFLVFLPRTFATEKRIQEDIENQVRKRMGIFLGEAMGKDQSVGSECLGYVSYYSRRTVYDWPGLACRKVVEFNRAHPNDREVLSMFNALRPDFVVIRYFEYAMFPYQTWLDTDYRIVASFEAAPERLRDIFEIEDNIDTGFYVLAKNDVAQALDGRAPGIDPRHARAYRMIGCRRAAQGRLDEAVQFYRKALEIDPGAADTYYNLANTLVAMKRNDDAIAQFREALRLEPGHANARFNLGVALARAGRLDEAIAEYAIALRLSPDDDSLRCNYGAALARKGRNAEAIEQFREAVRIAPKSASAHFSLALTLAEARQIPEAVAHLKKTLTLDPQNAAARDLLGKLEPSGRK